jgi:acetyl-CoA carboxylase biotin carboxyl carrier protein
MDFKQIKELIRLVNDSSVGEVLIEEGEFALRIRHQNYHPKVAGGAHVIASTAPMTAVQPAIAESPAPAPESAPVTSESAPAETQEDDSLITVKSPMIGTFYRASGPDKPPYVKVGDHIDKDDILCIIEAMKLFNEIESEVTGTIVKVLVENESPVEYDQPLFLIDPNG